MDRERFINQLPMIATEEDCKALWEGESNGKETCTCKGIVFRGYRNKYFDGKKIVFKEELRILKRKSCSGCEECGYLWEAMHDTDNFYMENSIEHGSLYSIRFSNISRDWETGDFVDFDLEVFPITEEGEEEKS